jgi:prepilin-type N-terminal cleavage/methylation domain-containing protein/prepilin-type processing-associated H-X9-DG protein
MTRRKAFSLIELLVVMAIIAVLIGLLLPAIQKARDAANRTKCTNNLKQVTLALLNYNDVYGSFPQGTPTGFGSDSYGFQLFLYPFLEQGAAYEAIYPLIVVTNGNTNSYNTVQIPANATIIRTLLCPSDEYAPKTKFVSNSQAGFSTNYVGNNGSLPFNNSLPNGILFTESTVRVTDVIDGTSNTFAMGEIVLVPDSGQWDLRGKIFDVEEGGVFFATINTPNSSVGDYIGSYCVPLPQWAPCGAAPYQMALRSYHTGGVNASFCDGSVQFISNTVNAAFYLSAGSRNGGEVQGPLF